MVHHHADAVSADAGDALLVIDMQHTPASSAGPLPSCPQPGGRSGAPATRPATDALARVNSRHIWLQEQPSSLRRRSNVALGTKPGGARPLPVALAAQESIECDEPCGSQDAPSSAQSLERQCGMCDIPEFVRSASQEQQHRLLPAGSRMLARSNSSMGPHGIRLQPPAATRAGSSGASNGGSLFGACGQQQQQQLVDVTVVDYSKQQVMIAGDINNYSLAEFLAQPRPTWSKVRWINVQGSSFDVIEMLSDKFDLHPLSVEDIVHIPQRIKAEFFPSYLHVSVLLLSAGDSSTTGAAAPDAADVAGGQPGLRMASQVSVPAPLRRQMSVASASARARAAAAVAKQVAAAAAGIHQHHVQQTQHSQPHFCTVQQQQQPGSGSDAAHSRRRGLRMRLLRRRDKTAGSETLSGLDSLHLAMEQVHLLLFKDGTLLSFFSNTSAGVVPRVLQQLEGYRSLLTDSEDASYLLHAILDGLVDNLVPVVNMYASHIERLEAQVLQVQRPRLELTQDLHQISNHVKALRRALVPTQALVHKLQCSKNRGGFLSKLTATYMHDVLDHINTVVEDMDTLCEDAKGLIDLIFDKVNHNVNASMRVLAVMSTLFLPITFIAGVYGTNFEGTFPEIHWSFGYWYFLSLCAGVTITFLLLLRQMGMWGHG